MYDYRAHQFMSDIIHLLSDTIANQIAAGEVIQRPASVVKELVENAIDAKATTICIFIKDAGKSLIQVVDDGIGMSETDARMAFERHATSKIKTTEDLFSLKTLGFRGEALASIVSVSQVELKTRKKERELGTLIRISGSRFETQESIATSPGSIFSVKNLFFNIPARRKFLKSNETEFKNILAEFERIVLVNPQVSFSISHNDTEIYNLPASSLRQRILSMFGKNITNQLLSINVETSLAKISGFIGTPASAKKRGALQYFFVNDRYMRHPYFHKAITSAFEPFIPAGEMPNYFIYFQIDPSSIDVNIHPTKTEIKFENEQAIWQITAAAVKEAIGKANAAPSIEFDREGAIEIPVYEKDRVIPPPKISLRSDYNPFKTKPTFSFSGEKRDWDKLFERKTEDKEIETASIEHRSENPSSNLFEPEFKCFRYRGKFLILPTEKGLMIIDHRRATIRILFDEYMKRLKNRQGISQRLLFPEMITFTAQEATLMPCLEEHFSYMGFDLANLGNNSYSINGIPDGLENTDPISMLKNMVNKALETGCEVNEEVCEALALSLAVQAAGRTQKKLSDEEADHLVFRLFESFSPTYTPDGKTIISVIDDDELEKRFK